MHKNIADGFVEVKGDLQTKLETVKTDVNTQIGSVDRNMQGGLNIINASLDTAQDNSKK